MITALCGGVGGSKLALGLYRTLPPDTLTIVVNTADDLEVCGLHVSPDLDTVTYTLAGLARRDVGWGIEGDTFRALDMIGRYGGPTWFQIGDADLATHVFRTWCLREGCRLTEATQKIVQGLGARACVLPMSDDPVATRLLVGARWLAFQDYFVRRRHQDVVTAVKYEGVDRAHPTHEFIQAIARAEIIVLVNSNPVLSILPIISLPGVREALQRASASRLAVSPIVGDDAVTGPAGRLMKLIGQPASATGVARTYDGLIHGIVIDQKDAGQASEIEGMGIRVLATETVMRDQADQERLARETLDFARALR